MNLTEGREQVDAGNLGVNSRDGAEYEKERILAKSSSLMSSLKIQR